MNAMLSGALGKLFRSVVAVSAVALLASCGGGEQSVPFEPTRMLVFGDELSVIVDSAPGGNGKKYTINAVVSDTDPTLVCQTNPIWTQVLAGGFGLVFPQCNPNNVASPASRIYAEVGATVADVEGQIDDHLFGSGSFSPTDLVTVLVGAHDVEAQYKRFSLGEINKDQAVAAVEAAGTALGVQIKRIADADGRVIFATTLDLGLTPYALAEKALHTDTDRADLLTFLSFRFNAEVRIEIEKTSYKGRRIGLVETDVFMKPFVNSPASNGYVNVTESACKDTVSLLGCSTSTLKPAVLGEGGVVITAAATDRTWLWADNLRIGPSAHSRLGQLALTRATRNPF